MKLQDGQRAVRHPRWAIRIPGVAKAGDPVQMSHGSWTLADSVGRWTWRPRLSDNHDAELIWRHRVRYSDEISAAEILTIHGFEWLRWKGKQRTFRYGIPTRLSMSLWVGAGKGSVIIHQPTVFLNPREGERDRDLAEKADVEVLSGGTCTLSGLWDDDMAMEALQAENERRRQVALEELHRKHPRTIIAEAP